MHLTRKEKVKLWQVHHVRLNQKWFLALKLKSSPAAKEAGGVLAVVRFWVLRRALLHKDWTLKDTDFI